MLASSEAVEGDATVPAETLQSGTAKNQLAVADWSPINDHSEQPVHREGEGQGGVTPAPEVPKTSSTEDTTESDSEKDAAEVYVSGKTRQVSEEKVRGKQTSLRQKRAATAEESHPRKLRCPEGRAKGDGKATAEESEAIAALEHFKNAGSIGAGGSLEVDAAPQRAPASPAGGLPLNMTAIQELARLLQRQQQAQQGEVQQSPFQGRPASPGARVADKEAPPHMRSCFSESSAEKLGAIDKKDGTAMALLQSIMATNNHFHRQAVKDASSPNRPGFSIDDAVTALKQAKEGPGAHIISMPSSTPSSSAASEHALDLTALFALNLKNAAPAFFAQQGWNGGNASRNAEAAAPASLMHPLAGGFGSIIPGSLDCPPPRQSSAPFPVRSSNPPTRENSSPLDPSGGAERSGSRPLGFSPIKQHGGREASNRERSGPARSGPPGSAAVGMPDPRILDWVLGNRGSLTDRSKGVEAGKNRDGKEGDRQMPRVFSEGRQVVHPPADATQAPPTLRRPVPLRVQSRNADSMPSAASDPNMDLLLARLHACSTPTSLLQPTASGLLPPPIVQQQPGLPTVAGDMQRVMQWAGAELSLRDRKVKEVERQRMEERAAHDNTISAVAAEVSRLKFGQAELVKAHRQYQEALVQKDQQLEERNQLIARLSKGLSETRAQCKSATQENESLRQDIARLSSQLAQYQPAVPVEPAEAAAEDVPTGEQDH